MTSAHINVSPVTNNPALAYVVLTSQRSGFPFIEFQCDREELIAALQYKPQPPAQQMDLPVQVPQSPPKRIEAQILG